MRLLFIGHAMLLSITPPFVLTFLVFFTFFIGGRKRERTITKRGIYSDIYNAIFRISKLKGADNRNFIL